MHQTRSKVVDRKARLIDFLRFAATQSPYYREKTWAKKMMSGGSVNFEDIPLTRKSEVQNFPQLFKASALPSWAGGVLMKSTSGSTGFPSTIFKSESHFATNANENLRLRSPWNLNQHRVQVHCAKPDENNPFGSIKKIETQNGVQEFTIHSFETNSIESLLQEKRPSLFKARGTLVEGLLELPSDHGFLSVIYTLTESISDTLRHLVQQLPHCAHLDVYGAVETGIIAATCPKCGCYHVAHDNLHLEVLTDRDQPAEEGQLGRVVVTVTSNPAMPLVRYDLGDIVRFTRTSLCEPGAISFTRIYGRERMMFHLPSGGRVIAHIDAPKITEKGIKRYKLVQIAKDLIEFRYQGFEPDFLVEQRWLESLIAEEMSPEFKVIPKIVTDFPLSPSGKYMMHERLIELNGLHESGDPRSA